MNIDNYIPYDDNEDIFEFCKNGWYAFINQIFPNKYIKTRRSNCLNKNINKHELINRVKTHYKNIIEKKFKYNQLLITKYLQFFNQYQHKDRDLFYYDDVILDNTKFSNDYSITKIVNMTTVEITHLRIGGIIFVFKYDLITNKWISIDYDDFCLDDTIIFLQFLSQCIEIGKTIRVTNNPIQIIDLNLLSDSEYRAYCNIVSEHLTINEFDISSGDLYCEYKVNKQTKHFLGCVTIDSYDISEIDTIYFVFRLYRNQFVLKNTDVQLKNSILRENCGKWFIKYYGREIFIDNTEFIDPYIARDKFEKFVANNNNNPKSNLSLYPFYGTELFNIMASYLSD